MHDATTQSVRICSWTLSAPANAGILGAALRSVAPWTDENVIIFTGTEEQSHLDHFNAAHAALPHHRPFEVKQWAWTGSFADARNAAMLAAFDRDCDWTVMVDDDERPICPDPVKLRAWLAALSPEVTFVCAHLASGVLQRERFVRRGALNRWRHRTHEILVSDDPREQVTIPADIIAWDELHKTPSDVHERMRRDLKLLAADLEDYPGDGRTLYYIGQAHRHLGEHQEAIDAFRKAHQAMGGEFAAWAAYLAAESHCAIAKRHGEAGDAESAFTETTAAYGACIASISKHPLLAEPYNLAAAICLDMGKPEYADGWAKMAQVHAAGSESDEARAGFKFPHALNDGPADMIARADEWRRGIGTIADDVRTSGERFVLETIKRRVVGRAPVVFDVGANRGQWATLAREVLGPNARIVCFEPIQEAAERIDATNEVHVIAMSDDVGHARLSAPASGGLASGMASLANRRMGEWVSEDVPCTSIDLWCSWANARNALSGDRIDLLKIDVEGLELHVIRGASGMIADGRIDAIQFEFGGACVDSRVFLRDFFDLLDDRYMIARVTPRGLMPIRYSEREEVFVSSNLVALSKSGRPWELSALKKGPAPSAPKPSPVAQSVPAPSRTSVRAIVFSRDRAMQLDACLRSLDAMCGDKDDLDVCVLFKATTEAHAKTYGELSALYIGVRFYAEDDFERQTRSLLDDCEHVLFVTDDTIFVRPFKVGEMVGALRARPGALGYSLRLGLNCIWTYPTNRQQRTPEMSESCAAQSICGWFWPDADGDWGYPLELSSSLYRSTDIQGAAWHNDPACSFRNPNELEAVLARESSDGFESRPSLLSALISLAFSVPCNRVQSTYANRAGNEPAYTTDALLAKWQEGYRINVEALAGHTPKACHEEVAVTFVRRTAIDPLCDGPILYGNSPHPIAVNVHKTGEDFRSRTVFITVTSTGFCVPDDNVRKCIESVVRQTVKADHVYVAADDGTLAHADTWGDKFGFDPIDGSGRSALANLLPLWRALSPDEVVVWLDGDDWLDCEDALEIVARAHAAGAWVTYGQFRWSTSGARGFADPHRFDLPRSEAPWRATILRTFRAGLVQRIKEADLRWPHGSCEYLDATLDQAIMLPVLEMAGPERSLFIPKVLAVYYDCNIRSMSDEAKAHEAKALKYIRSRPMYDRIGAL